METLGAIFLGGSVSNTISGGVANPLAFAATPDVFAYGKALGSLRAAPEPAGIHNQAKDPRPPMAC
jgi:phosphate/sulfate permease